MKPSTIATFVRRGLLVSLAAAGSVLVACGGTAGIPDGFTPACDGGSLFLAKGFKPTQAVDFIGFREEATTPRAISASAAPQEPGVPSPPPSGAREAAWTASFTADVRGIPCSGASDKAACERKIASLRLLGTQCEGLSIVPKDAISSGAPAEPRETGYCATSYLVYTRGDEVGVASTAAAVRGLLGIIDSPQEAMYLAKLGGENLVCTGTAPAYAAVENGYDVVTGAGAGAGACETRIVRVSGDGTIQLVKTQNGC